MLEKSIKLFNTFIRRQYLRSAESIRVPAPENCSQISTWNWSACFLQHRCPSFWVLSLKAGVLCLLMSSTRNRHSPGDTQGVWKRIDRIENRNRAPGCVVLCVPSGIAMSETKIQIFCFRKNPRNLQRRWRLRGQKECTEKFTHSSTLTKSKRVRACAHLCRLGGSLGFWWQVSIHLKLWTVLVPDSLPFVLGPLVFLS